MNPIYALLKAEDAKRGRAANDSSNFEQLLEVISAIANSPPGEQHSDELRWLTDYETARSALRSLAQEAP